MISRRQRLARELGERLTELRSAPLARACLAGAAVSVTGRLLRRPREGAIAGLAVALVTQDAAVRAADGERVARNGEDLISILPRLGQALTTLGNWGVDPDFARLIATAVEAEPGLVVELGSGVSTQLIASILEENGTGRLVSVDHDRLFADRTVEQLRRQGSSRAEVIVAPLRPQTFGDTAAEWYDADAVRSALPDGEIDLLVIDGPPTTTTWSRWPALEVLGARLAPGATILLDDGRRRPERATARRWSREHPELDLCWHDTLKGAWRLERRGVGPESRLRRAGRHLLRRLNPNPVGFGRWPVRR